MEYFLEAVILETDSPVQAYKIIVFLDGETIIYQIRERKKHAGRCTALHIA